MKEVDTLNGLRMNTRMISPTLHVNNYGLYLMFKLSKVQAFIGFKRISNQIKGF